MSLLLLFNGGSGTPPPVTTYPLRWKLEISFVTTFTQDIQILHAVETWVDVTSDVRIAQGITAFWGQRNAGPTDRVAQVGTLEFVLDDSEQCSGGLGYYATDNTNCRTGFEIGAPVLLSWTNGNPALGYPPTTHKKFYITDIAPTFGIFGERSTVVRCVDYIEKLGSMKLNSQSVLANQNTGSVIYSQLTTLPLGPLLSDLSTGLDTFPLVFHDITSKTTVLNAWQRLVQSDLGYLFVDVPYETLTYQNRQTRLNQAIFATFDNSMTGLDIQHGTQNFYNYISVKSHPAKTGAAAETLWTLQREQQIAAGQTITIKANYTDPSALGLTIRLSPGTGVAPVSGVHYKMWAGAGGTGSNISADLSVGVAFYAANASITLTNNNAATGYISNPNLYIQGKIIRLNDTVESISQMPAGTLPVMGSFQKYGEHDLSFDMPYQDNPYTAQGFADFLLMRYGSPNTNVQSVEFVGNGTYAQTVIDARIGKAITVKEDVTGINNTYWINGIEINIASANVFHMKFYCEPATSGVFWSLAETGFSELGESTNLNL